MIKQMSKKYRLILLVSVLGLLVTLSTATFAYLKKTPTQSGNNIINTLTCLDINLSTITDGINISGDFPVTDEKGKTRTPYTFTVTNLCDNYVEASINLESLQVLENPISREYMKAGINEVGDGIKVVALDTTTNAVPTIENALSNKLMDIELNGLESKNFELRLWIDEDVTKEQGMNKTYRAKVVISAGSAVKINWDNAPEGTLLYALKNDPLNVIKTPKTEPGKREANRRKEPIQATSGSIETFFQYPLYGYTETVENSYPGNTAGATITFAYNCPDLEYGYTIGTIYYNGNEWTGDLNQLTGMCISTGDGSYSHVYVQSYDDSINALIIYPDGNPSDISNLYLDTLTADVGGGIHVLNYINYASNADELMFGNVQTYYTLDSMNINDLSYQYVCLNFQEDTGYPIIGSSTPDSNYGCQPDSVVQIVNINERDSSAGAYVFDVQRVDSAVRHASTFNELFNGHGSLDNYNNSYDVLNNQYAYYDVAGEQSRIIYIIEARSDGMTFLDNIHSEEDVINNVDEAEMSSAEDDYGTSYYFRGNVENNYVLFAGKCWQIVRVDGNGNIKLILNNKNGTECANTIDSIGNTGKSIKYNSSMTSNAHIGYMYGTAGATTYEAEHANINKSTIMNELDKWFQNNMLDYSSKLADVVWCNDKSIVDSSFGNSYYTNRGYNTENTYYMAVERLEKYEFATPGNDAPTFSCRDSSGTVDRNLSRFTRSSYNGNGALDYKVGLITADEAAYAGYGLYDENTDGSAPVYLSNGGYDFWTMTPAYFYSYDAYTYQVNTGGIISAVGSSATSYVRPMVALKASTNVVSGNGTRTNPYVVE